MHVVQKRKTFYLEFLNVKSNFIASFYDFVLQVNDHLTSKLKYYVGLYLSLPNSNTPSQILEENIVL